MSRTTIRTQSIFYQVIVIGAEINDNSLYGDKGDALLAASRLAMTVPQGAIVSVRQVNG
jgi:hypothetical protein